ncbi:MAG: type II toxin-antitoxin system VapC family toxin [Methylococcaceae bacterium]|nr:type II toxin-antitoxin system VapC family toxin [Methylococcaceae bacterium]MCI0668222.1 type II toxin-antitoxin system VapC family toxin [Methylococcaceae bacterium]MCI0733244.1 type II toxin-antitoxin system VapC family toxin [Methylococcaceae bacterium]
MIRLDVKTHLILWWPGMRDKEPANARDMAENSDEAVYMGRASLWELAIKVNRGKLRVDMPRFCQRIHADGFSMPPIEDAHILQLGELPLFADHKDPFDRLLVAQSLSEPLILLTVDDKLVRYGNTVQALYRLHSILSLDQVPGIFSIRRTKCLAPSATLVHSFRSKMLRPAASQFLALIGLHEIKCTPKLSFYSRLIQIWTVKSCSI